jgi:SPP1 gp7 family putative phage head morphogenesis protein
VNKIHVSPPNRQSQDIQKWRNAIMQAEGYSQQRKSLLDLYEDIRSDGYLRSVVQRRIDRITNCELVFRSPDGTVDEKLSRLAQKSYFEHLLRYVMETKFYGHSLIEPLWPAASDVDGEGKTILIPRKNVKPRWGIVTKEEFDLTGVEYRKPPWKTQVIEVGDQEDLGLFMAVAQYVIYKRGNFGDWAEYAEIFGIPFRWATYNNEQSRLVLEEALEKAGPAGYVIAPEDAKMQFLNANAVGTGSDVFRFLRQACNEEIALAVLGNTMTSIEARSSGYAQSETQADYEDEMTTADRRFVLRVLNEKLVPYLGTLGYDVKGEWEFLDEDQLTLGQRIDIDLKVATQVPIADTYWYETYGIPKPEASDNIAGKQPEPPQPEPPAPDGGEDDPPPAPPPAPSDGQELRLSAQHPPAKKKSRRQQLDHYYKECCSELNLADDLPIPNFKPISKNLENAVRDAVSRGDYSLNRELHSQLYARFRKAARAGFSRSLDEADDAADFELQQGLLRSASRFAAAKQGSMIEELRTAAKAPPDEYARRAKGIMRRYHGIYLDAEMISIETAANTAGQWRDFLDRADLYPNLMFSTVGDDRVRPTHAALDGAIYPVDDPFWDVHSPPLGWRCRCVLIQTDDPPVERPALAEPTKGFGQNPAKMKALVDEQHPYYTSLADADRAKLFEQAEMLRAEIERPGAVRKAAEAPTGMLRGKPIELEFGLTPNTIFQDAEAEKPIRMAMVGNLAAVAEALQPVEERENVFQLSLLGIIFEFLFGEAAEQWVLEKISVL